MEDGRIFGKGRGKQEFSQTGYLFNIFISIIGGFKIFTDFNTEFVIDSSVCGAQVCVRERGNDDFCTSSKCCNDQSRLDAWALMKAV